MFVIESKEIIKGGMVRWEGEYRIRHITTNRYLSLAAEKELMSRN